MNRQLRVFKLLFKRFKRWILGRHYYLESNGSTVYVKGNSRRIVDYIIERGGEIR